MRRRDGTHGWDLPGHAGDVQQLAWSPDGAWLASGDDHGNVFLWPKGQGPGRQLETTIYTQSAIGALAFSGTGTELLGGDHAGRIWVWKLGAAGSIEQLAMNTETDIAGIWSDGAWIVAAV